MHSLGAIMVSFDPMLPERSVVTVLDFFILRMTRSDWPRGSYTELV